MKKLFRRFNGFVLLNIAGLALGLTGVIFISVWVGHEMSYDRFFKNADRIYRVESLINLAGDPSVWTITPAPVAQSLIKDFPEIEDAVVLQKGYQSTLKSGDKLFTAENLYFTDSSYFKIFFIKIISGNRARLLSGPDEIVISRRTAEVLFGNSDPLGKTVLLNNTDLLTVTGIMENSPTNTHLSVDYLVPFSLLRKGGDKLDSWTRIDFITYILLKEKTNPVEFNNKLAGYWKTKSQDFSGTLFINPLTRLYLYRDPGFKSIQYPGSDKGPITRVILFSIIGLALLIIACINFINLSTAYASQRAKEMGIRKANGATRRNLILLLFSESFLQTCFATVAGLILAIFLFPIFIRISGVKFTYSEFFSLRNIVVCLSLVILTGFMSGIYPALILSSFSPARILKPVSGELVQGTGLRKILVIVQFVLAGIFLFCVIIIDRQIKYMHNTDMGFEKERVLTTYPRIRPEYAESIAEQIKTVPGVSKVALGGNVPVNMGNFNTIQKWDGNNTGKPLMFFMMQVDDNYLDLLGIKLIAGRQFFKGSTGQEVIINETAAKKMEMSEPLGKTIWLGDEKYTIIGMVKDFHFHKLKEEVKPVFIYKNTVWHTKRFFVKFEPGFNNKAVTEIVRLLQKESPGYPVNYMFLDQELEKYYGTEKRLSILLNAATILTIFISCIGLFSLTAFTVSKRKKEIGIRKAYGSSVSAVIYMLQKDFAGLLLISLIIALPAGYLIGKQWLNSYASHISVSLLYYIESILIITLVSEFSLIYHTLNAANANPADTLRNE